MKIEDFILKIKRKWMKMRLEPIRVFCFHHVCEECDTAYMNPIDWLSPEDFKRLIGEIRVAGYTFISLQEAHEKLKHDWFRCRKYAVLTADDGWSTLNNILPWIHEQQIPITLFLNPAYFDGKHFRQRTIEKYLSQEEVERLPEQYPLLTVGSHGWEHKPAIQQTKLEFTESVVKSVEALSKLPNYIPYFAYTWGWHTDESDRVLMEHQMIIVNTKGRLNYNNVDTIEREVINLELVI